MEQSQADQLLALYGGRFPIEGIHLVRKSLVSMDYNETSLCLSRTKDPTIAIILSVLAGGLGIDRFYLGQTLPGVLKLITCGGLGIWALVDLFLIMGLTREYNMGLVVDRYAWTSQP